MKETITNQADITIRLFVAIAKTLDEEYTRFIGMFKHEKKKAFNQLVNDLSFPIEIKRCPIIREENGLAMSSRNQRLSIEQREQARVLYQSLEQTKLILKQTKSVEKALQEVKNQLKQSYHANQIISFSFFHPF